MKSNEVYKTTKGKTTYSNVDAVEYYALDTGNYYSEVNIDNLDTDSSTSNKYRIVDEASAYDTYRRTAADAKSAFDKRYSNVALNSTSTLIWNKNVSFENNVLDGAIDASADEDGYYATFEMYNEIDDSTPARYEYDITFDKDLKITEMIFTRTWCYSSNWDSENHKPASGQEKTETYTLKSITYVDDLAASDFTNPLLNTSGYFITSVTSLGLFKTSSMGLNTPADEIMVGDFGFSVNSGATTFLPATALDVNQLTITGTSDDSIIGTSQYGDLEAFAAGEVDVYIGNAANDRLYTYHATVTEDSSSKPAPIISGFDDESHYEWVDSETSHGTVTLAVGETAGLYGMIYWGQYGQALDPDQLAISYSTEGIATGEFTFEFGTDSLSNDGTGIFLVIEGLAVGTTTISWTPLDGTDYSSYPSSMNVVVTEAA